RRARDQSVSALSAGLVARSWHRRRTLRHRHAGAHVLCTGRREGAAHERTRERIWSADGLLLRTGCTVLATACTSSATQSSGISMAARQFRNRRRNPSRSGAVICDAAARAVGRLSSRLDRRSLWLRLASLAPG